MRARPIHRSAALPALPAALLTVLVAGAGPAAGAAPAPCGGIPQITDPARDGHHPDTDVLSAWFSEAGGTLQAVLTTTGASHEAEHSDAAANVAAYVVLFDVGDATRYVRAQVVPGGPGPQYDTGTYRAPNTFASAGPTTGSEVSGPGGSFTIDVPGVPAGTTLARPFVLTYDGVTGGVPDWVDHAPGGVAPTDPGVGADYVVGSCTPAGTPATPVDPGAAGTPTGPATAPATTGVLLTAPASVLGGGPVTLRGRVSPPRAGVPVDLTISGARTVTRRVTTLAGGRFALTVPLRQTSTVRAVAQGVGSQTAAVTVRSAVRITVSRLRGGIVQVRGVTRPALPGRVLLLRSTSSVPTATAKVGAAGRFRFRLTRPRAGRYQVVYLPTAGRAERATSNTIGVTA